MTLGLPRHCEHSGQHPLHAAQVPHSKRTPATATSSSPAALGLERAHLEMCLLPASFRAFAASRLDACRVFAVSDPSEVFTPSPSFSGWWLPPSCMLVILRLLCQSAPIQARAIACAAVSARTCHPYARVPRLCCLRPLLSPTQAKCAP